jgi:hypothetical protein
MLDNTKTTVCIRVKGGLPGVFYGFRPLPTGDYERLVFVREGKANVLKSANVVFWTNPQRRRAEVVPYTVA